MITVDAEAGRTIKVRSAIHHRCPFRDELDVGEVEVQWRTWGKTLEMHALQDWLLTGFRQRVISHEDLTGEIAAHLADLDGIDTVRVTTFWSTAGMVVEVSG